MVASSGTCEGTWKEVKMSSSYVPGATSIEIPLRDTDEVFLVCARDHMLTSIIIALIVYTYP